MPSPFPGMDPYIERPEIWPDFHDSFIAAIRGVLQPLLRPRYAALTHERIFDMEADWSVQSEIVVQFDRSCEFSKDFCPECDVPAVFDVSPDEMREPYIQIIEPAAGNRVVTAIEVLSPTNKSPGEGQISYWKKRDELWAGGVNLVEIDLLRDGDRTVNVSSGRFESLRPWRYIVAVARRREGKQEVYAVPLQKRLPRVALPLATGDRDVPLDLQTAFDRCWNDGAYPELLHYESPPPGTLDDDERAWCVAQIAKT